MNGVWTVAALKEECKRRGVVGYSRLLKADLIRALNSDGDGGRKTGAGDGAGRGRPNGKGEPQVLRFVTVHIQPDRSRCSSRPSAPTKTYIELRLDNVKRGSGDCQTPVPRAFCQACASRFFSVRWASRVEVVYCAGVCRNDLNPHRLKWRPF